MKPTHLNFLKSHTYDTIISWRQHQQAITSRRELQNAECRPLGEMKSNSKQKKNKYELVKEEPSVMHSWYYIHRIIIIILFYDTYLTYDIISACFLMDFECVTNNRYLVANERLPAKPARKATQSTW